jgi:hypothetical protein
LPRFRELLERLGREPARPSDAWIVWVVALVARAAVVVWGAGRFPPAADGTYYQIIAARIAEGLGYTWLWPDGSVTYAAHYPVGYPALIGGSYALFGSSAVVAMALNALVGSAAAPAAHALVSDRASRTGALVSGGLVALHPALVFYTPALMTEGFVAALLVIAAWLAALGNRRGARFVVPLGLVLGMATLVRPQTLLLAPLLGLGAVSGGWRRRTLAALATSALAIATCLPWTVRNCARMDRCVLVSANAGWNLLIGASPEAGGTFAPVADQIVPSECRTVFAEAEKDVCFGRAAVREIGEAPGRWIALVPAKLAHTFDFGGAAGWYLHASNPHAFPERAKLALGAIETLWQRAALALALLALGLSPGPRRRARVWLALGFALSLLGPYAWLAYLGFVVLGVLHGRALLDQPAALGAVAAVATTAAAHAAFFGAGRYGLVCYALVCAVSGALFRRRDAF